MAKNQKYNGYQRGFASVVYTCFGKTFSGGAFRNSKMSD